MDLDTLLTREFVFLDGAMGTQLQRRGLPLGAVPELANLEHPDWLADIHRSYVEAGSDILYANTFGANREKLARSGRTVAEVVSAGVALARQAAAGRALVALDVGPLGQLLEPNGTLRFEEAYDRFAEVMEAGAAAGADLVVIETMTDLQEARAALLAAKERTSLPVLVSMSFEADRRTFLGCGVASMALTLSGLGADAIGINCSLGPLEMAPLVDELKRWTDLPLLLKPNAGLPDPAGGGYDIGPEQFAAALAGLGRAGVQLLGGCCGTGPEHIALLRRELEGARRARRAAAVPAAVCSGTRAVAIDRVRVIGERINPTGKKRFQQALREGDMDYILSQALAQTDAGADILDVNVGLPDVDEVRLLPETVRALQAVTDAPLQLDSTDPAALEGALRACCGKAIVNSVNGDPETLEAILPLVKKYGAAVVGLTLDQNGIPKTAEERLAIARRILDAALALGIPRRDVYIDCLTLTVSAEQAAAGETLRAVRMVKEELRLKTVLGVSNISFGLPARPLVNQNFLTMAMTCGLDLPILNPNVDAMMAAVRCFHLLTNVDAEARDFLATYGGDAAPTPSAPAAGAAARPLGELVELGLRGEAGQAARALLAAGEDPMALVDGVLIPALDRVGAQFEAGQRFLPQLIQAAGAAQAAFEAVREALAARQDGPPVRRAPIVLATVKGDIHDIGKNIVKVLLENYGFAVLDLGRDVDPERVARAVRETGAPLVGLSALMTTTLKSMEETIALLRREELPCRVMVGGAVLTADYAARIGADFYARDAKESVDIARRVMG